jgi:hypothetical protein
MHTPNLELVSSCRFCSHYQPEGRRGGNCTKLQASVGSDWRACSLSSPLFCTSIPSLEHEFMLATDKIERKVVEPVLSNSAQN